MEIMEGVHLHLLLLLVTLIKGIQGQAITPSSVDAAVGDDVSLECITTTTSNPFLFTWSHVTSETVTVYTGGIKNPPNGSYDNFDLDEDTTTKRSTLIINSILLQDAGRYRCTASGQTDIPLATVNVEVGSDNQSIALTVIGDDSSYKYQATCDAIGSSPEETITWILDGVTQPESDSIVETDPQISDDDSLFDKRSVFTFPSTTEIYNVQLECDISGHQVPELNRQITRLVNIHKPPQPGVIMIDFTIDGTELTILCNDTNSAAVPAMSTFYIYSDGTLITKPVSDKAVTITEPEQGTVFTCIGGNYLENTTTTQRYGSTTTPPPTTATEGTSPVVDSGGPGTGLPTTEPSTTTYDNETGDPKPEGLSAGAVAGIVIGVIACIVIIIVVILYLVKPECCPCFATAGLKSSGSGKKPAGSAVGSSNGSEKDKINQPVAVQRSQASIQHTANNPGQELYALPERKQPAGGRGGDAPDRGSGPGQNEPQDIFYAALDLSSKAGHTEKHIPKNENDVVVYSSILV